MIKFIALVFSVCLSQNEAVSLLPKQNGRIIGGENAFAGEYPFLAAIYKRTSTGTYFCAGTLIYNPWVVTAGQCVVDAEVFTVRVGSNSLNENDPNALTVATEHYFLHPEFNPETLENDIGLIKFRQPIQFTDYITSINGFLTSDLQPEETVLTAGWGQTSDDAPGLADTLNGVSLITLSNAECKVTYGSQVTDEMVCAAGNYNEGLCQGDIGGPLFQRGTVITYLVGIASFLSSRGCENTDPSGFTRIAPYIRWITNITQSN